MTIATARTDTIIDELRQVNLFTGLPESTLVHFAEKSHVKEGGKGKVLFIQGDESEWFYVVTRGWVKLFRETLEGSEAVIDVVTNGHAFGENAVFNGGKYSYSAEIIDPTRYIMLPTSLLEYHVEKQQRMAMNMLSGMARMQNIQSREIEHLNVQNAPQRIACFLLRLCPSDAQGTIRLNLPYDKLLIASRLGIKAETFSRALGKLKQDTNLKIDGSAVTIPSLSTLIEYTCTHCSQTFPCEDL